VLRPHVGDVVLEIGAGIGNLTGRLMGRKLQYVATERDPLYLHALTNRFLRTPNVAVRRLDPERPEDFESISGPFDTALCVNVLEYMEEPAFLRAVREKLKPGGALVVLSPQCKRLYGSMDRTLGHKRRFDREDLIRTMVEYGFHIERVLQINRISTPAWWLFGRVLRRRRLNKVALKLFDKTVWLWRRVDFLLPFPGLSLIAIARRPESS